ncbi:MULTISPECIES: 1-phosphofructokinase family hexose kinase [unclassified Mycoplasma]|uniref:1-phosphofructokinase n=1 Tax=unclassified Mycoplasma TaxID=2683645 RepID=UPI00211CC984|nr:MULTISPECIES: 1-phosphofructokinase family hexose kinase [unclassified Mycoplasma]UUM20128.1 1-phosphofructokinase family hexose kinase [Mycoplasma sp. 1578d]UUM25108.1 1-phosphofructokinase family hexose kinase [Mycoplasma sp. 3686d]
MIYTLTLSPSVDLLINSNEFELEKVNRYEQFAMLPGGKGLNASVILTRHGFENKAITLFDKQTFAQLETIFKTEKLEIINIALEQQTRINIKYYGKTTIFELNGPRAQVTNEHFEQVLNIVKTLTQNDVLMLMGTAQETQLIQILQICMLQKVKVILDVESDNFLQLLEYKPFLIKPNKQELEKIFKDQDFNSKTNLIKAMRKLQACGASNVIVSLGERGSFLLTDQNEIYNAQNITQIRIVSATGAGDTLISMFGANYLSTQNAHNSLHWASAAATGTVQSAWLSEQKLTLSNYDFIQVNKE